MTPRVGASVNDDHERKAHRPHGQRGARQTRHEPRGQHGGHERRGRSGGAAAQAERQGRPTRRPQPRHGTPGDLAPVDVEMLLHEAESGAPPDLSDPRVVRRLLRQHDVRPNKGFGQHLLVDRDALAALVAAAELAPDDAVLEVGAGMGVLTAALAERAGRVVTVEMEREILPLLRETIARFTNVEIIEGDLLLIKPGDVFGAQPYKVVANLPYYITGPALRHFLDAARRPERIVVMVQKEVAERMTARPGDMSMLALSVQYYGRPQVVRVVEASSFLPPPKVDSAIVRIDLFPQERTDPATRDVLFGIARAGFAERRKQLHNTLARNMRVPRERLERWLAEAHIEPSRRAETLSVEEWIGLAQVAGSDGYTGF